VDFSSADGTAAAGSDYTAVSGSVTITAGSTTATISVPITDDAINEIPENYTVDLANPSLGAISDATGDGTITDNDAVDITINDSADLEDVGSAVFTVTLNTTSVSNIVVDFNTADGSAAAGSDYTAVSGSVTITAGFTTGTI